MQEDTNVGIIIVLQVFVLGRRVHPYIDRALELALQVGPQLRKPTTGKPPPRPLRNG